MTPRYEILDARARPLCWTLDRAAASSLTAFYHFSQASDVPSFHKLVEIATPDLPTMYDFLNGKMLMNTFTVWCEANGRAQPNAAKVIEGN